MTSFHEKRVDSASIHISADRPTVYRAFTDPEAIAAWLPPSGMKAEVYKFEARNGGALQMALFYNEELPPSLGKTAEGVDRFQGTFLELVPDERIVMLVEFESDDPSYAGEMRMTWTLTALQEGTRVTVHCEHVPEGIRQEDHIAGLSSTLENLAAFTES